MAFDRIAVVGAGAWGCALANVIARAGRPVLLATRDRAGADHLVSRRESPRLPGLKLDERIGIAPLSPAVGRYDAVLLAVPSQHLREAAGAIAPELAPGTPVIACAKGIERGTHRFMTEVIAESAGAALPAILSGPSFAADVARGLPAAVTLAALPHARWPLAEVTKPANALPFTSDVTILDIIATGLPKIAPAKDG